MSKPVQFSNSSVKYQPAMMHFAERSGQVAIYSAHGFIGVVAVGAAVSLAAVFSRGRFAPSANFFNAWHRSVQLTGSGFVVGGLANGVASTVASSSPFAKKASGE